jgi:hypothetical protein
MDKKFFNRNDMFLLLGILGVLIILCLGLVITKTGGKRVSVSVDGAEVISFSLDDDLVYEINGYNGGRNVLVIKDGVAYLSEASCPDHLCMNMGKIKNVGQSVICLPNRVVVAIKGNSTDAEYDTITN